MNARFRPDALPIFLLMTACTLANAQESGVPADPRIAGQTINALGIDLLRRGTPPAANALLSPYSIQTALAMAYAGADGETRREMAAVLHYPGDETSLHGSLAALRQALDQLAQDSARRAAQARKLGGSSDPVQLTTANRLFGQTGYGFREPFLGLLAETYQAPLQLVDYLHDAAAARLLINDWVETETRGRIRDLLPADAIDQLTRLVLVNAVYLKAPWADAFSPHSTQPQTFTLAEGLSVEVPTMVNRSAYGYHREPGFQAVTVPYSGGGLHCLILLPDAESSLAELESSLTTDLLGKVAASERRDVVLHLPKFELEPPVMPLGKTLQALGITSAFDIPPKSANFDRMAPRRLPDDYLLISEVFHKAFLKLDEAGTEAAAATAVIMARPTSVAVAPPPDPITVKVDRPFLFAIQHPPSGACLFVGRMQDPR